MREASRFSGDMLDSFKKGGEAADALSWEMLFWERWKRSDHGFVRFDADKIEQFLRDDERGRGRLHSFKRVLAFSGDVSGKRLLNIGAGRDFLLERFSGAGCAVVEQDIVLESLLLLKKRGAAFCVCCDARWLPFEDDAFDVVTSFSVLHHVLPAERSVEELLRVANANVYINEPNHFAFTRLAFFLPAFLKRRLKKMYTGDRSHSPYEAPINPYRLRNAVKKAGGSVIAFSYEGDSWIPRKSRLTMKILRIINLIVVRLFPVASAHFDCVIEKKPRSPRRQ
jgi:SAM-dependent methyltransferase